MAYEFTDVLTGSTVTCEYPGLQTLMVRGADGPISCESVFFPGCSLINYAMPLVSSVYDLLKGAGKIDGISLLCCGKILAFEPNAQVVRPAFEGQLRDAVAAAGAKRIITACPNCTLAIREAFAEDDRVKDVEILPLPVVLAELGYRIDGDTVKSMIADAYQEIGYFAEENDPVLAVHDSCPDRSTGEFAEAIRQLLPEGSYVEMEHNRKRSVCCGSLPRAAGKEEQAQRCVQIHCQELMDAKAKAFITACISCTFQLSMTQYYAPSFYYLELLFKWRINWNAMDGYMKLRFLFDECLGVCEAEDSNRAFVGLGSQE